MSPTITPCPFCARSFQPRRPHQRFCSSICRNNWHNAERKAGKLGEIQALEARIKELEAELARLQPPPDSECHLRPPG